MEISEIGYPAVGHNAAATENHAVKIYVFYGRGIDVQNKWKEVSLQNSSYLHRLMDK